MYLNQSFASSMEIQPDNTTQKKIQNNRVKVAIRVRPFIQREIINQDDSCVQVMKNNRQIILADKLFRFDRVFSDKSTQPEVYNECVKDLVIGCFQGYNAAILAYGQTGSGKTFTMGTTTTDIEQSIKGIIPRVITQIFDQLQHRKQNTNFQIKASFLEIYNQNIIDLLSQDQSLKLIKNKENTISIRDEKDGSVSIHGITQENVRCADHMLELLDRGSQHRTTASTMMNEASSRSHAIFSIFIEQSPISKEEKSIEQGFITAKFVFVDLAGSQRVKKTGATGATLKQGININLGLLQLGNVISALSVEKKQPQFITFRNSKLTRILQDSLGGNSNTYMIACISPAQSNYEQSLNTIKYASKAMNIKTKPVINRDPHTTQILQLKARISQLQNQNGKLKNLLDQKGIKVQLHVQDYKDSTNQELKRLQFRNTILQKKCETVLLQSRQDKKRRNELEINIFSIQRERDLLKITLESLKKKFPQLQIQTDLQEIQKKQLPLIQTYITKNQDLQTQLLQKEKIISQLQIQYTKLHDIYERDQKILRKKNDTIYNLSKASKQLKKELTKLQKQSKKKEEEQNNYSKAMSNRSKLSLAPENNQILEEGDRMFYHNTELNLDTRQNLIQKQNNQQKSKYYDIYNKSQNNYQDQNEKEFNIANDDQQIQDIQEISQPEDLSKDEEYNEQISNFSLEQQRIDTELKQVQKSLSEKQNFLTSITNQQMELQFKLIQQMKQEYHRKIYQLEIQKSNLITQRNNQIYKGINPNGSKIINTKIDALQSQLKILKKRGKQQRDLQKKVTVQNNQIKNLSNQIKQFRLQKIELNRKLKQDKDNFIKFKNKRTKQILLAKKQNMRKDGQIRKLTNQNKKQTQQVIKKKDQIKKMKKINETLKNLLKPKKITTQDHMNTHRQNNQLYYRHSQNLKSKRDQNNTQNSKIVPQPQSYYDKIVNDTLKPILLKLDHQMSMSLYLSKCQDLQKEIQLLKNQQCQTSLQIEKLKLKLQSYEMFLTNQEQVQKQKQYIQCQQLEFFLMDLHQRLSNLQENLDYFCQKYQKQSIQDEYNFDLQVNIIYNPKFNHVQCQRCLLVAAYACIYKILRENMSVKQTNQQILLQKQSVVKQVQQLKEQITKQNSDYQRQLSRMRQELMIQQYHNLEQLYNIPLQSQPVSKNQFSKLPTIQQQRQLKALQDTIKLKQKKIDQLSKINRNLSRQLQMWRNKCNIIQQKYNNLKNLTNKDKYIGINKKEQDDISKQLKQKEKYKREISKPKILAHQSRNQTNLNKSQDQNRYGFQNQQDSEQMRFSRQDYNNQNNKKVPHMLIRDGQNSNNSLYDNTERQKEEGQLNKNISKQIRENNVNPLRRQNSTSTNINQVLLQTDRILQKLNRKVQAHSHNNMMMEQSLQWNKKEKGNLLNHLKLGGGNRSSPFPYLNICQNQNQEKDRNKSKVQVELFDKNQWKNIAKINAHSSPVLSMATTENLLISGATRSVKIWDYQNCSNLSDITGFVSFVRSVNVDQVRGLLVASSDQNITLWDMRQGQSCGILTAQAQQIQTTHITGNYLFAGAKTIFNSNGLLMWDLRKLDKSLTTNPTQQKQRNLSVFSMTSYNNILYYGTRDHLVRRLKISNMQTLPAFQPPHMDIVTALCILNESLISGSKDKNLKLWDLESSIYNGKYTIHACIDHVTSIQADKTLPIFYAADRSGQVKIGKISQQKIKLQFLGGITAHSQSVNAVCSLSENNGLFATGSSDKSIKLWKPSTQKLNDIK